MTNQTDMSHISPITENSNLDCTRKYFANGWGKRPGHGKTKGHACMTSTHKEMIQTYFYEGEDDKETKKSTALMAEAMTKDIDSGVSHPNKKRCIPCVSEVTAIISQMSTCRKKDSK